MKQIEEKNSGVFKRENYCLNLSIQKFLSKGIPWMIVVIAVESKQRNKQKQE